MSRFVAPEWKRGYRYISFRNNLIAVKRERPVPILMTYSSWHTHACSKSDFFVLGRFMFSLVSDYQEFFHEMPGKSHNYHVWGIENRAVSDCSLLAISLVTLPLVDGDGFLLNIKAKNPNDYTVRTRLEVIYGGLDSVEDPRETEEFSEALHDEIELKDNMAIFHDSRIEEPELYSVLTSSEKMDFEVIDRYEVLGTQKEKASFPLAKCSKQEWVIPSKSTSGILFAVTFGNNPDKTVERAKRISDCIETHLKKTRKYFLNVTKTYKLTTSEPVIDKAFETAVLNLEYTWYKNLGWMEIISYWCDLWAQTHILGICSLRQLDRVRSCLKAHAETITGEGKVRVFNSDGKPRDGNDWEHFFLMGTYRYYLASNDTEFIREIWPSLVRMYHYCFSTKDRNGDSMLVWGSQVENQEDELRTYNCGSSATMAGIYMSEIMADFAKVLHKTEEQKMYLEKAGTAGKKLFRKLWKKKLGRFIWWIDEVGVEHRESQYHTYAWPVIFGLTDMLDSYTSLRHIRETLLSQRSIVYDSNQFAEDRLSCLGAQESILSSGTAALAFGKSGNADMCARILKGCSECIVNPPMEKKVPEQAQIDYQSYFSSAAASFVLGVTEGLCGFSFNLPENRLNIQPSIPEKWKHLSITLPDVAMTVKKTKTFFDITVKTKLPVRHRFKLEMSPGTDISCFVNKQKVTFHREAGINKEFIITEGLPTKESRLVVKFKPLTVKVNYEHIVVQEQSTVVAYEGFQVTGIEDREKVLAEFLTGKGKSTLIFKKDVIPGEHTVFLKCRGEKEAFFYYALDFEMREKKSQKMRKEIVALSATEQKRQLQIDIKQYCRETFEEFLSLRQSIDRSVYKPEKAFLSEIRKNQSFIKDEKTGFVFRINGRKLGCAHYGKELIIPVNIALEQVYFLLVSYVTAEDTYSKIGQISVNGQENDAEILDLRIPGNINWGFYYRGYETSLKWTKGLSIVYPSTVLDIIGINCRNIKKIKNLCIKTNGFRPVIGLLAVTGITPAKY